MSAAAVTEAQPKVPFKVAISSFLGNFIEWFDYATYTYFAITIGIVFFPESAVNSTLLAFAVFALSFVFRPLGAAFWGSMGDKKGRKWSLSLSIFMMTGAAFLIGCLPSYETIGLLSPILLLCLRSVQGFSAAGEYSGAAVFLAEYAPANHRGKYCSLVPASTAAGLLAGSTAALIIKALLPEADVISWGWRIPFLLAGPLGLVAHYIRTKLEDSPTYQQMTSTADPAKEAPRPTRLVFKKYKKRLATSIAATMVNSVGFYLVLTYLPTYLTSYTAMEASAAQLATDIALVTYIFIIFGAGKISDIVGRKKMLLGSCVAFILLSIPAFMMLETAQLPIVIAAELIMCVTLSFNDANIACYQAEMFPTEVRYTGAALGSNIAYVVFGGTASMVATALIDATGNGLMPAYYMMGICLVAGIILLFTAHEYAGKELNDIEKEEGAGRGASSAPSRSCGALAPSLAYASPSLALQLGAAPGAPRFGVVSCGHGFSENICGGDGAHRRRRTAHAARDRLARRPHLRHRPRARGHSTRFSARGRHGHPLPRVRERPREVPVLRGPALVRRGGRPRRAAPLVVVAARGARSSAIL